MKRLIRDITLFFIIFVFIFSCRPITLSDKFSRNLQYDLIWVGWLDLGEQHYAELGYGSKEEWGNEIKKQNMNLQRHIQGYMRGWIVKGANAKTDEPPKDVGTVIITFKNTELDTQTIGMNFSTDADFIDAASQEVVIALGHDKLGSTLFLNSFPFYSLSGRLNDAMSRMSYDILYYMTQSE